MQGLVEAGLAPYPTAVLWLASGGTAADPEFHAILSQLTAEGVGPERLEQIATWTSERTAEPGSFASLAGLRLLHLLLGSWKAAVEAAVEDEGLLRLPSGAEAQELASQLVAGGCRRRPTGSQRCRCCS